MHLNLMLRIRTIESKLDAMLDRVERVNFRLNDLLSRLPPRNLSNLSHETVITPVERIIRAISEHYLVPRQDLLSRSRSASIVWPRQVAIYLLRMNYGLSYPECARAFGRTAGAARRAVQHVLDRADTEPKIAAELHALTHQDPRNNA